MRIQLELWFTYILAYLISNMLSKGYSFNIKSTAEYMDKSTCPLADNFRLKDYNGVPGALIKRTDNNDYLLFIYCTELCTYIEVCLVVEDNYSQFILKHLWLAYKRIIFKQLFY